MWIIMPLCPLPWSHLHIYLSRKTHIRQFLRNWVGLGYFVAAMGSTWLLRGLCGWTWVYFCESRLSWLFCDCFHMTAKCVFWILIQNAHFELRSVHTIEVLAYFELRSIHTSDRNNWKLWFSFRERGEEASLCLGSLPIKHARVVYVSFACAARGIIGGSG